MSITSGIEASQARAERFTREIFEEQWPSSRVVDFVNERRNATIASVNHDTQPHAAVVIAGSVDDEIFFTVNPDSVLHRNINLNDRIAASICDSRHAVMCQGRAVRVGTAANLTDLVTRLATAAKSGTFTPPGWSGEIYRLDVRRLVAN